MGMSLEKQIAAFLADAAALPAPSKLEPYTDLIRQLRQRRWTYQRIAAALCDEFGVSVAPSTVHHFVKVRAKKKDVAALPAPDTSLVIPPGTPRPVKKPRFNLDA